jgi:hypothetical protein
MELPNESLSFKFASNHYDGSRIPCARGVSFFSSIKYGFVSRIDFLFKVESLRRSPDPAAALPIEVRLYPPTLRHTRIL